MTAAAAPAFTGAGPVRSGTGAGLVTAGGVRGSEPGYRLAANGREQAEDERLDLLEQLFDPGSRRRLEMARPGWRCLVVGAGCGSMAAWLAQRVGPAGQVVATDIDCRYLDRLDLPNLQVVQHPAAVRLLGPATCPNALSERYWVWPRSGPSLPGAQAGGSGHCACGSSDPGRAKEFSRPLPGRSQRYGGSARAR